MSPTSTFAEMATTEPAVPAAYAQLVFTGRAELGESGYTAAYESGQRLTLQDALALARPLGGQ